MGLWNYYFIAKLALYYGHWIGFHRWENLGFALLLLWPLKNRARRLDRDLASIPVAISLLYYDSWLPPFYRLLSQAGNLGDFSGDYLLELLGRFINPGLVLGLILLSLIIALLGQWLRITTLTLLGLLFAPQLAGLFSAPAQSPAQQTPANQAQACTGNEASGSPLAADQLSQVSAAEDDSGLDASLERFFANEATRRVEFPKAKVEQGTPYDLIFLHICSLSWDDIRFTGDKAKLLERFQIVFDHFNAASTYSGPAAIRFLRGNCGQPRHDELYSEALPACYLFHQLEDAGFSPQLLMNHDGHFGEFLQDVQRRGGLNLKPQANDHAKEVMHGFDGSPIYEDISVLEHWWRQRLTNDGKPVALFYNSITLHDGNKIPGVASQLSIDTYPMRYKKFMVDLESFLDELEHSQRKAIVVLIAEHGAALSGDSMQISGLREIPSPKITLVPAAIRLIGLPADSHLTRQIVSAPSSYLALSTVLARMIEHNPFDRQLDDLDDYTRELPQTEFVAENEKTLIMRRQGKYLMRTPDQVWMDYVD